MTNVVSRNGYNIPVVISDAALNATNAVIGDAEDFKMLKDQVSRSGILVLRKSDPTQPVSFFFANVESNIAIQGYRLYPAPTGMYGLFITITTPVARPTEMLYTGTNKTFTAAT